MGGQGLADPEHSEEAVTMNDPSGFLVWSFSGLTLAVAAAYPLAALLAEPGSVGRADRRHVIAAVTAAGMATWLSGTLMLARSGVLAFGPMPPRLMLLIAVGATGAVAIGMSDFGRRLAVGLPLAVLVGLHVFRLPLELLMHRAYVEGVMPGQMSYTGWNFDIATGASALVVASLVAAGRMPRSGVLIWNLVGSLLLLNVVVIAWLSTPGPWRLFHGEPANVWITTAPFVWLPTVLVMTALLGHILIFRRLMLERPGSGGAGGAAESRS